MVLDSKLIFMHIPKNGGTTLDSILDKIYQPEEVFNIKPIDNTRLNHDEFKNLPKEDRNRIKLLKGHLDFGMHEFMNKKASYITLLRKPEERIISFYYYVLNRPRHRLYKQVKNEKMSLYDFVTKINQGDVNNAQIRVISGIDGNEEEMLQKALENIENHFSFVGLVEKFNESMLLLEERHQLNIPYYKSLNKTSNRVSFNELDNKTKEAIIQLNKGDALLYNEIESKFNSEINAIKQLKLKQMKLLLYNNLYKVYSSIFSPFRN